MTLVNLETGEIVSDCTLDEARDLTERMRSHRDETLTTAEAFLLRGRHSA